MRIALALRRSDAPSPVSRAADAAAEAAAPRSASRVASRALNQASVPAASGSHHWPFSPAPSPSPSPTPPALLSLSYVSVRSATHASKTPASAFVNRESASGKPHWSSPSRPPAPPASPPTTRLLFFKSTTMFSIKRARRDIFSPPTTVFVLFSAVSSSSGAVSSATRSRRHSTYRFMPTGSSARRRGPATRKTPRVRVASSSLSRFEASSKKPQHVALGNNPHTNRRANTAHRLEAARAFSVSRFSPKEKPRASSSLTTSAAPKRAPASGPSAPASPATNAAITDAYCEDARGPSTRAFRASSVAASPTARRGKELRSAATPETMDGTLASPMRFINPRTWRFAVSASAAAFASAGETPRAFALSAAIAARSAGGTYVFPIDGDGAATTPDFPPSSESSSASTSESPSESLCSSSSSSSEKSDPPIPNGSPSSSLAETSSRSSSSLPSVTFGRRDAVVAAARSARLCFSFSSSAFSFSSASSARSSRPGRDSKKLPSPSSGPFCLPLSRFRRRFCSASSRRYASSTARLILRSGAS
mmetsp:Transcript_674/g.2599  ORF Transcript_674/g.2599 Transcript_674/m.2599 type:complete len:537 (+) Transcript_674:800-2410(+)